MIVTDLPKILSRITTESFLWIDQTPTKNQRSWNIMLLIRRFATSIEKSKLHIHPQNFKQYIQLTDGSISYISCLSPSRPFIKLNIDSLSHPSWNSKLRDKLLLDDHGEVARFRKRFGSGENDFTAAADQFVGETRKLASQTPSTAKPKGRSKKK